MGAWGESQAVKFLKRRWYKILECNYRVPFGEIDIIAKRLSKLYFIEVKTRTSNYFGWPEEAVGERKREKLEHLADYYLEKNKLRCDFQFGIISIIKHPDRMEIKYFEDI